MASGTTHRLSKSRIMLGLQCGKALYLSSHSPELKEKTSEAQQRIFDQGHEVGRLAQSRFPGGTRIDAPHTDPVLALRQTQDAIKAGALNIYEATLMHDNVLVKVDILSRASRRHAWQLVEVKSSTQVKDVHVQDAAIQLWVCRGTGLKVKSASIMTINNRCVFPALDNLFNFTDVTVSVKTVLKSIPSMVAGFKLMLAEGSAPAIDIGPQCNDPYPCSFKTHCWAAAGVPEISVFNIPKLSGKQKWEFYRAGQGELEKVPTPELTPIQQRMVEYTTRRTRFIDPNGIVESLKDWKYPLSFLDFETIGYAIPKIVGQRPYQQLPFQFSCHIRTAPGAALEHREYLHTEDTDPREAVARALAERVPATGSVVAYNMGFESSVLKGLADRFAEYQERLLDIAARLVDPLPIFRAHVYDPQFRGSFSIKDVAPAILGVPASYEGMSVGQGVEAQWAYMEMTHPKTDPAVKEKLQRDLIEYCTKDTLGMVQLVDWLYEIKK